MREPDWTGFSVGQMKWELMKYRHWPGHVYGGSIYPGVLECIILKRECEEEGSEKDRWWCWKPLVKLLRGWGLRCRKCHPVHDYGDEEQGLPNATGEGEETRWVECAQILKARKARTGERTPVKGEEVWKAAWIEGSEQDGFKRRDGWAVLEEGRWRLIQG